MQDISLFLLHNVVGLCIINNQTMSEFKQYKRKSISEMRPYVVGEDLSGVSVSSVDTPEEGGMIARNPKNHADQWYVAKKYFEENLEAF